MKTGWGVVVASVGLAVAIPAWGENVASSPPGTAVAALIHRVQVMARAADAVTRWYPLDYERPFGGSPYDDGEPKRLYLEACELGDRPACWLAANMDLWRETGRASALVLEHCRAGDMLSCRALPPGLTSDDAPGAVGRSQRCRDSRFDPTACDVVALRRECASGFPLSCQHLRFGPEAKNLGAREALDARILELSLQGCEMFIRGECGTIWSPGSEADDQLSSSHRCPFGLRGCGGVPAAFLALGDRTHARGAAERLCQYDIETTDPDHNEQRYFCLELALAYAAHDYVEPVPGRGQALMKWACASSAMREISKECQAYVAKQERAAKR